MAKEHALTTWRKSKKLSQAEVAEQLGVSRWMVNRLEVGERTPSMALANRLNELSGGKVTPNDFLRKQESAA
ncbi:helix-turn-helix transcriptional regulator [Rhizobium johnstonii]|uniref:helix-turn-helix transcriptional regulator n=1 Tax=Rhizobium johnstonii TaxID=3019933 RepID=UPI003F944C2E